MRCSGVFLDTLYDVWHGSYKLSVERRYFEVVGKNVSIVLSPNYLKCKLISCG